MNTDLNQLLLSDTSTLHQALEQIDRNAQGLVFIVDEDQKLTGVITDGDARRAILSGKDLQASAKSVANRQPVSLPVESSSEAINAIIGDKITHIPLLDRGKKVIDYACAHKAHMTPVMEPFLNGNEKKYVVDCLNTKWISSQGKYVSRFERDFETLHGGGHAVAVANGTVALHLALVAAGIGAGDEVIVPNLTFAATANAVLYCGATPVFVDCLPGNWGMDPGHFQRAITAKTKAVIPVHLYGYPCEMDEICKIAKDANVIVLEDCAESLGSRFKHRLTGTFGESACFSFFGNKMITTGEGGMVLFRSNEMAEHARQLRDHGMSKTKRYWHLEVGFNYRMTNLQAAIGVAQLEQFSKILDKKIKVAKVYGNILKDIKGLTLPPEAENGLNSHWLYTVLIDEEIFGSRDALIEKFAANGVQTRPIFYPLHLMPPYAPYSKNEKFPNAMKFAAKGISLPSSAELTEIEVERIATIFKKITNVREMLIHAD